MVELKYKTVTSDSKLLAFLPLPFSFNYSVQAYRATPVQSQHLDDTYKDIILKFHYGFLYMHIEFPFLYKLLEGIKLNIPSHEESFI